MLCARVPGIDGAFLWVNGCILWRCMDLYTQVICELFALLVVSRPALMGIASLVIDSGFKP